MGILESMAVGSVADGWVIGLVGWLVLRLIGRLDALATEQARTRVALEALLERLGPGAGAAVKDEV